MNSYANKWKKGNSDEEHIGARQLLLRKAEGFYFVGQGMIGMAVTAFCGLPSMMRSL